MKYYKHIYLKKLIRSNKLYISKLKTNIYNPRELSSVGIYVIYTGRSLNPRYSTSAQLNCMSSSYNAT